MIMCAETNDFLTFKGTTCMYSLLLKYDNLLHIYIY